MRSPLTASAVMYSGFSGANRKNPSAMNGSRIMARRRSSFQRLRTNFQTAWHTIFQGILLMRVREFFRLR